MNRNSDTGARMMRRLLMSSAALAGLVMPVSAQSSGAIETVVVTGYQHSLVSAAEAKRNDIGFTDSIFAEDIGKFPDSNVAEAINRIPGVVLNRDPATGEGLQISVRGLGSQYTKIVLNNTPIAVATASGIDQTNSNRETDMNMFPGELFSNISVAKSSRADQLEGGAAGTVNMRSRRPFDRPGPYLSYNLTGTGNSITNGLGGTAALIGSDTWSTGTILGDVGMLVGVVGNRIDQFTSGWDDGNGGWATPTVKTSASTGVGQCATATGCDNDNTFSIGGNYITIPATLPRNVTFTGASGHNYAYSSTCPTNTPAMTYSPCAVNAYTLADINPKLGADAASITNKLANALFPRLLRNMYQRNNRWKYNGVTSIEVRPSDSLHFYVDMVAGKFWENIDRTELTQPMRSNGAWTQGIIPGDVVMDSNNVVKSFTSYNAQWAIDTRHYANTADFFAINPGMTWQASDLLYVEVSANASRSHWIQTVSEMDVVSCPSMGTYPGCTPVDTAGNPVTTGVVTKNNFDGKQYIWSSNIDPNNPRNYQWASSSLGAGGGVSVSDNKRYTQTYGLHIDLTYGGDFFRIKGGAAYDVISRNMIQGDASGPWSKAVCQGFQNTTSSACDGRPGSYIAQQSLYNYLVMGPTNFLTFDYTNLETATNMKYYNAPVAGLRNRCAYQKATPETGNPVASSTGSSGCYEERILGSYVEAEGKVNFNLLWDDQELRYNVGLRYVTTRQTIDSPFQMTNLPQTTAYWGNAFYDYTFVPQTRSYDTFLPSASLVYKPLTDLLVRASASRTMTRASLPLMTSNLTVASLGYQNIPTNDGYYFTFSPGNPELKPYYSTNLDVGVEYYTGKEGYISVSAFRKFLHGVPINRVIDGKTLADVASYGITYDFLNWNQIQNLNSYGGATNAGCTDAASCAATPVRFTINYNQPGVQVYTGLEFGYTQPFDFILEDYGLPGFGISNNLTMIDFKQSASNFVIASDGSAPIHASAVPHYSYNGTLYWQGDGFSARLSYNYRTGYYSSGTSGANSICLPALSAVAGQNTYQRAGCQAGAYGMNAPYSQFDFSSSAKISKIIDAAIPSDPEVSIGITNLFRTKFNTYFQYPAAQDRFYLSNQTFSLSLRGTF